jgi:hypothetical protein
VPLVSPAFGSAAEMRRPLLVRSVSHFIVGVLLFATPVALKTVGHRIGGHSREPSTSTVRIPRPTAPYSPRRRADTVVSYYSAQRLVPSPAKAGLVRYIYYRVFS